MNFDVENNNGVSTLPSVINIMLFNVVSTLTWRCPVSQRHINLTTTLKRRWNVCQVEMYLKGEDMDVVTFPTHFNDLNYQIIKSLVWLPEFTSRGFPWENPVWVYSQTFSQVLFGAVISFYINIIKDESKTLTAII